MRTNRQSIKIVEVIFMQANEVLNYEFKIGLINELFKKGLLKEEEAKKAKQILKNEECKKC